MGMTVAQAGEETGPRVWMDPALRGLADFSAGDVVRTRGRTIEAGDILAFAGLVGNYYPLHVDAEYARATRFGALVAHGSFIYSIAVGLVGMADYYGDGVVALLEVTDMRATRPVHPGDTISVGATVTAIEPTRSGSGGRMSVRYSVQNQRGDDVLSFTQTMLIRA